MKEINKKQLSVEKSLKFDLNTENLERHFYEHQKTKINSDKMEIIDWKNTQIYKEIVKGQIKEFNSQNEKYYFTENELKNVLVMIQEQGIVESDLIKPFYLKSSLTLLKLIEYCNLSGTKYYDSIMNLYKDINVENTLKLLIRSKQL